MPSDNPASPGERVRARSPRRCRGSLRKPARSGPRSWQTHDTPIGALEDVHQLLLFVRGNEFEEIPGLLRYQRADLRGERSALLGDVEFLRAAVGGGRPSRDQAMAFTGSISLPVAERSRRISSAMIEGRMPG